ncbi:hypothetical protein B0H16DRAFT_1455859 [Mycena metata]|uniref:Uncharacterized protein n=1 Tax=Mycena metata TaxID=1033252 RepID=A0AAD7NIA2_9AGAR|nr:hypothetical protein B0H16DRAFT_1455859 [Mycena metata]
MSRGSPPSAFADSLMLRRNSSQPHFNILPPPVDPATAVFSTAVVPENRPVAVPSESFERVRRNGTATRRTGPVEPALCRTLRAIGHRAQHPLPSSHTWGPLTDPWSPISGTNTCSALSVPNWKAGMNGLTTPHLDLELCADQENPREMSKKKGSVSGPNRILLRGWLSL